MDSYYLDPPDAINEILGFLAFWILENKQCNIDKTQTISKDAFDFGFSTEALGTCWAMSERDIYDPTGV